MKLRYLISLSLAGALLLGACGGGDDDDDSGDSGDATAAATSTAASDATKTSEQPTTAPGNQTAEATKPASTKAPESANSVLQKLASESVRATYQATYDIELAFNGQVQKGTAIYANEDPNFAAVISLTAEGSGGIKLSVISKGAETYVCTDFGIGGTCSKDTSDVTASGVNIKKALSEATEGRTVKEVDGRTIAGRKARCFEATDTSNSVTTYCIDDTESIMLALETGGVMKMTAKEVTKSVDESLFELPFPVN